MILTNPNDPHSLYRVDLGERGEVVEEWKVHDDIAINNMAPNSKFAPTTNAQTFLGTSHNALFRIDPRISGSKFVQSESKQYATKAKFSSLATTQLGKVVVASAKGDLRLFDSVGKIAKTALPALGDPIIGVDTTADGEWVVATTKTALLVFDMTITQGKYAGSLGFDRSFPADAKPTAKRLMLSSQHAAYMGGVSFTPARFVPCCIPMINKLISFFLQIQVQYGARSSRKDDRHILGTICHCMGFRTCKEGEIGQIRD